MSARFAQGYFRAAAAWERITGLLGGRLWTSSTAAALTTAARGAQVEAQVSDVVMPRLSDSMEEGTILRWLKADGGRRQSRGDELVEIETDKATMTYEADQDGALAILVAEGRDAPDPERSSLQLGDGSLAERRRSRGRGGADGGAAAGGREARHRSPGRPASTAPPPRRRRMPPLPRYRRRPRRLRPRPRPRPTSG